MRSDMCIFQIVPLKDMGKHDPFPFSATPTLPPPLLLRMQTPGLELKKPQIKITEPLTSPQYLLYGRKINPYLLQASIFQVFFKKKNNFYYTLTIVPLFCLLSPLCLPYCVCTCLHMRSRARTHAHVSLLLLFLLFSFLLFIFIFSTSLFLHIAFEVNVFRSFLHFTCSLQMSNVLFNTSL